MKRILKILGVFLIALMIVGTIFWIQLKINMNKILEIELITYDFSEFDDGLYTGSYYYEEQIGAIINLNIENNELISIEIVDHVYGLGKEAELIVNDIILEQNLDVDAISGATTSSKIIQLAIQDALENGVIE